MAPDKTGNSRNSLVDRTVMLILPALVIAFIIGGGKLAIAVGRHDESITTLKEQYSKQEDAFAEELKDLKAEMRASDVRHEKALAEERTRREADSQEARTFFIEILKEIKTKEK